jgi:hypothetical protein
VFVVERPRDIERERHTHTHIHTHTYTDLDGGGVNVLVMWVSFCSINSLLRSFCDIKKQGSARCREDIKRRTQRRETVTERFGGWSGGVMSW